MSCLSQGHLEVWSLFPYPTCEGVAVLRQLRPMPQETLMALFKFTVRLANQAPLICPAITISFMFIDF